MSTTICTKSIATKCQPAKCLQFVPKICLYLVLAPIPIAVEAGCSCFSSAVPVIVLVWPLGLGFLPYAVYYFHTVFSMYCIIF